MIMVLMSMSTVALNSWVEDGYLQLLADQIAVMLGKEDAFYSRHDYLGELPESGSINKQLRQKPEGSCLDDPNHQFIQSGPRHCK